MTERPPPPECANCGATIPRRALACPECGADERTGWRETDLYDGLDLPDDTADEPHASSRARPPGSLAWYWWAAAVGLLLWLGLSALGLL